MRPSNRRVRAGTVIALACCCGCKGGGDRAQSFVELDADGTRVPSAEGRAWFTDVSVAAGLHFPTGHGKKSPLNILEVTGGGCAFLDYNNDGWLDLLLVGEHKLALYENEHGGKFRDVSEQCGLAHIQQPVGGYWMGCAVGDFDNDGWRDVFISGYRCNLLLRNDHGRFLDTSAAAGIRNDRFWETSAAFLDVDGDGWLDLYVGRYVVFNEQTRQHCKFKSVLAACPPHYYQDERGVLYRNNRDGTFTDFTRESGLQDTHGRCLGVTTDDFNDDGKPDLYLANDGRPCDLYYGLGGGRFRNAGIASGTAYGSQGKLQAGMGCDFGDYNNDGRPDLIVTTFYQDGFSLYRNEGNGFFLDRGMETGLYRDTIASLGFGVKFLDFNNDGWLDLIFANGHVQDTVHQIEDATSYRQRPQLMMNREGSRFEDVSAQAGPFFRGSYVGRGLSVGDYDNDGGLDVLFLDAEGGAHLLHNDIGNERHWLRVRLEGSRKNLDGSGARVRLVVGDGSQIRQAHTDGSYLSASDPRVHFGLGDAARVDRVEVRWPSGARSVVTNVRANREIVVKEAP